MIVAARFLPSGRIVLQKLLVVGARSSRPVISIGRKLRAGAFSAVLTGVAGWAVDDASLRRY
jgi:hypothetical protein